MLIVAPAVKRYVGAFDVPDAARLKTISVENFGESSPMIRISLHKHDEHGTREHSFAVAPFAIGAGEQFEFIRQEVSRKSDCNPDDVSVDDEDFAVVNGMRVAEVRWEMRK